MTGRDPEDAVRAAAAGRWALVDLRDAQRKVAEATAARNAAIRQMHDAGWRPPVIARSLAATAAAAGMSEAEIAQLGISEHNVRFVLRTAGLAE